MAKTTNSSTANVFSTAKTVAPAPAQKKKGAKEEVFLGDNLDQYAAIDSLTKTLKTFKDTLHGDLVDEIVDTFVETTIDNQSRPDNFKGIGNKSEASCELRKRSSASVLTEAEVNILKQSDVTVETVVLTPATEETFSINPAIVSTPKLANAVSKALSSISELKGMDIIFRTAPQDAVTAQVVSDQSFLDAAKITDATTLKQIYDIIGTPAIKAKMAADADLKTILALVEKAGLKLSSKK